MKVMMASIPDSCPLKDEFANARIWKNEFASALDEMIGLLSSYLEWQGSGQAMPRISGKQYDLLDVYKRQVFVQSAGKLAGIAVRAEVLKKQLAVGFGKCVESSAMAQEALLHKEERFGCFLR